MYDSQAALDFYTRLSGAKSKTTIGDFVEAVLSVKGEVEARLFLEGYVMHMIQEHPERALNENERIARDNIGFCFGEGMPISLKVMWKSIGVSHPFFPTLDPTPEQAFEAGVRWGERMQFEKEVMDSLWKEMEEEHDKKNV